VPPARHERTLTDRIAISEGLKLADKSKEILEVRQSALPWRRQRRADRITADGFAEAVPEPEAARQLQIDAYVRSQAETSRRNGSSGRRKALSCEAGDVVAREMQQRYACPEIRAHDAIQTAEVDQTVENHGI
jgi:hypothetical protein